VPQLSIIIVNHETKEHLDRCLASLDTAGPQVTHEIVVVDNGSRDGSAEMVRTRWPKVRLIETERNAGFAAANNRGIRATTGDLILLLNSDTVVPSGAIERLVDEIGKVPRCAAIGPRLVDPQGELEISFGAMLSPWNELRQKLLGLLYARRVRWAIDLVRRRANAFREVDWISGACLLVRRQDALDAGLLDERFFLYGEDVDFCAALRARGRQVCFTPAAEVIHLRGRARAKAPRESAAAYRESHLAFYAKHHPAWAPWLRWYLRLKGQLPDQLRRQGKLG
jgi:GT2 family glycosyltransferase